MDDNDVLSIINGVRGQEQNRSAALPAVLSQAVQSGTTPDQEAEWQRLAQSSGVPVGLIRNGAPVKLMQTQQQARELPGTHPATAQFLTDPDNAAVSHDDIGTLTRLEDLAKNGFGQQGPISTLNFGTPRQQVEANYFGTEYGAKPLQSITGGAGKLATKLAFPIASAVDAVNGEDYYKEFSSQLYDAFSKIQKDSTADQKQNFGGKLVRSIEELVPMVLSGGAGMAEIVGQSTNEKYDELTAKGVDHDTALAMAMKSGMTAYAMMKLPFGGGSLSSRLIRGATFNPAFGALDRGLEKAGLIYAGYDKQADDIKLLDPEAMAHEMALGLLFGAQNAIQTGRPIVGNGLMESLVPFYDTFRAARRADVLNEIGKTVQDSKVNGRRPEVLEQHLDDVAAEHSDVKNAYVPVGRWNELFQSAGLDPARVAAENLSNPEAYSEAVKTGSDIVIPFGEFATRLSKLEQYPELVKDTRLALGDTTLREAEAYTQAVKNNTEQGGGFIETLKNMFDKSQKAITGNESYLKIYDDLVGQQLGNGTDRSTAEHNAHMMANAFRVLGERAGVDPQELYQQYDLKLTRPMPDALAKRVPLDTTIDPLLEKLRAGEAPTKSAAFGPSLLDVLREKGLTDSGGELTQINPDSGRKPFEKKIIRKGGLELDKAREMAVESGYLKEGASTKDLLDAIDSEVRGSRVSSDQYQNPAAQEEYLNLKQLGDHLDRLGVDVHGQSNEEIRKVLTAATEGQGFNQSTVNHLAVDGVRELYQSGRGSAEGHEALSVRKTQAEGMLLTAVVTDGQVKVAGIGATHYDVNKDMKADIPEGVTSANGYVTPDGKFLDRKQANEWLKENRPDVYRQLDSVTKKNGLESQDYAHAEGVTSDSSAAMNAFMAKQFGTTPGMLFQEKQGYIRFGNDRKFEIGLLENANLSTFVHESGHFFTEVLGDLAARTNAPQQIKSDYAALLKFSGVESRDQIQTEHHETLARAFEAYIMEGKSPSVEMHSTFQRMKAWMVGIYKNLTALHVNLSDEVRGVFDRIMASDAEIQRMRDMQDMKPLFTTAADAGMSEAEFALYRKDVEQASERAKENLLQKLITEKSREQKAWWKDERKKTWDEVEGEAQADPIYAAYHVLTTGETFDGRDMGDVKISREDLVKMYGEAFVKTLPRGMNRIYSKEGGVHPDVVAEMAGLSSGDELIRKLAAAPKMKEWVKAETDARMRERHGDILLDGTIHEQALKEVHNDDQGRVLRAELQALKRKAKEVKPFVDQAKAEGKADAAATERWVSAEHNTAEAKDRQERNSMLESIPPLEFFKITARETMGAKRVAEIQPHLYSNAARKAAREAFDAAAKGDYEKAGEAKYRELLNNYLYREAVKGAELSDKVQQYATKMATAKELGKMGKAGEPFLDQIRGILDRYSFDRVSNKEADIRQQNRESLDSFLNRMRDDEGLDLPIPDSIRQEIERTSYRNLSLDDLRGVYDSMRMIQHAASRINSVNAEGKRIEVAQAALSLSNRLFRSIKGNGDMDRKSDGAATLMERVKDVNLDISVMLPEFIFERFDGLKKVGPWHEYIWDRYNDSADHQNRLREMIFPKIMEYARGKMIDRSKRIYVDGIKATLTKDDIIAIALNCGNESNLDKLMRGGLRFKADDTPQELNHDQIREILSHLSSKEIDVVNGIWKTIEALKPEAAALARKRTGVEPTWIDPQPMQVANGVLEGGYYPVKYDSRYSSAGERQSDASTLDQMFNKFKSSTTRQGYMKERTQAAYPMSLDWQSVVSRHLDEVITDISHWEFATDTQRLLKRPEVKEAVLDRMGESYYKNLLDWVRYTVNQDNVSPEASDNIEKFRRHIRSNMSTYVLGFKVANAVNEMAIGIPLMLQHAKVASVFKGVMQYMRSPIESTKFAVEASDYMKNLDKEFDRDINTALNDLAGRHTVVDDIRGWSIASRTLFWKIGATMAWHAGYVEAQSQGLQGKAAVRIADSMYRMTQESGRAGDLSAAQRNPYMKELTQFIGPTLIQYNNNRRAVMAFKDQGFNKDTAMLGMTTLLAGHVANALIFDLMRGKQPDDPDKIPAWILARLTLGLFDGFPVLRDVAGYAESKITGEKGKDVRLIPLMQWGKDVVDGATKTINAASGDGEWGKAILQDAKAVGGATGLPTSAGSITGEYIYDLLSGDYTPEHPWSPITDIFYHRKKH